MKLNCISTAGIYSANAIAMKAKKADDATIRDFKKFMKEKNLVLNATLTPSSKGFYTEIELSKKQGYSLAHVTDDNGYGVCATGLSLKDAILEMARSYRGKEVYINSGNVEKFKIPN